MIIFHESTQMQQAYFVNSTIDSGSEKSNPGIPSGGIFRPRVYS